MANGFEKWRDKWVELVSSGKPQEAEKIYWEKVFPHSEEKFVSETRQAIEEGRIQDYDYLIIPLGIGEEWDPILLINGFKPKKVLFLCTPEAEKGIDRVLEKTDLRHSQIRKAVVQFRQMDLATVYSQMKSELSLFERGKAAVDLTRGKRIMTTGAGIIGAYFGCDLIYIDEEWIQEIKRGKPGTERVVKVTNPYQIFGDLEAQRASELFNACEYSLAAQVLAQVCSKVADPREAEVKMLLSECYSLWDAYRFEPAHKRLSETRAKISQYGFELPFSLKIEENEKALSALSGRNLHNERAFEVLKEGETAARLAVDLLCNAERRVSQDRIEDASARLYRVIEIVSQHRLALRGIDSSEVKKIDEKTLSEYGETCQKLFGVKKTIGATLTLLEGHSLLYAMQDDLWKGKDITELKALYECAKVRDHSIVAHGLKSVSQIAFEKLLEIAKGMAWKACELNHLNYEEIKGEHEFARA